MKLLVFGCGNMGTALVGGVVKAGVVKPEDVGVVDVDKSKAEKLRSEFGVRVVDYKDAISGKIESEFVLIAVKPQQISELLSDIKNSFKNSIFVSIAAGVKVEKIKSYLGEDARIVRVMPNTPALVGEGMSALFFSGVEDNEAYFVVRLFESVGKVVVIENEELMDVITAVSGSGPAYFFVVMNAIADGAVKMGLSRDKARLLAVQTALGSAKLALSALEQGIHLEELKDRVSSPAGTTITALHEIEKGGLRGILMSAVESATKRSKELGK